MECLSISSLNYILNINLFFYSFFWNIMIFCFFVISIFVVVKECVVNSNFIFMLFFGICSSFFGVFIRAILVRVCQSCNIYNASPFLFCSFQSINLSIYLPTSNRSTNRSIRSFGPSFLKVVLSAETVSFIKTVYREV